MAYTTVTKSTDYHNTNIYTGNGGTNAITGVGHQPDFVWTKRRDDAGDYMMYDSIRGVGVHVHSNANDGNNTIATSLTAFNSDGFTLGSGGDSNGNNETYVSWNWKAGTTGSGSTTGSGTAKTYSYSVNTTAGFSIVEYTGNGTAGHTIPHHLGAVPKMILFKQITGANVDWRVYHEAIGNTHRLALNGSGTSNDDDSAFNDTSPTSSVFTVGGSSSTNPSADVVAYCFTNKTGYSKFGSYKGNGNADGTFIYTGFKPAFVIIKGAVSGDGNAGQNWELYDNKRDGYNGFNDALFPNTTAAESVEDRVDLLSNGFKIRVNSDGVNDNNSTYIYMAFGQSLVGSNNIPCNAR